MVENSCFCVFFDGRYWKPWDGLLLMRFSMKCWLRITLGSGECDTLQEVVNMPLGSGNLAKTQLPG